MVLINFFVSQRYEISNTHHLRLELMLVFEQDQQLLVLGRVKFVLEPVQLDQQLLA